MWQLCTPVAHSSMSFGEKKKQKKKQENIHVTCYFVHEVRVVFTFHARISWQKISVYYMLYNNLYDSSAYDTLYLYNIRLGQNSHCDRCNSKIPSCLCSWHHHGKCEQTAGTQKIIEMDCIRQCLLKINTKQTKIWQQFNLEVTVDTRD